MELKSLEELIDEANKNRAVLSLVYFDVHGNSPEVIKNSLVDLIGRLSQEQGVLYCAGEINETIESEGLHSTSAEVKLMVRDFATLAQISGRYGPIGFEIIKPDSIKMSIGEVQSLLLNISQMTQDFAKYIMEKTFTKEQMEEHKKVLLRRAELGKQLREKGK